MPSLTTQTIIEQLFDDLAETERFITLGEIRSGKEIIWAWITLCTSDNYFHQRTLQKAWHWWRQARKQVDFDDFIGCYDAEYNITPRGHKLRKQALER